MPPVPTERRRPWFLVCFVAFVFGSLGFFLGRSASSSQTTAAARAEASSAARQKHASTVPPAGPIASGDHAETASASAASSWDERWRQWLTEKHTPKSEKDMADAFETWARREPQRAMDAALKETNRTLRTKFRSAVLHGWGAVAPSAAATWAATLPASDRGEALQAVFSGGAEHPDQVASTASQLGMRDPSLAGEYGHAAIAALSDAGAFEVAAQFALSNPDLRVELLSGAYYSWALHQPAQALQAVQAIADPAARSQAFRGLILGWSAADPAAVAEYAAGMTPGKERAQAFAEALPRWAGENPAAASAWISEFEPSADFDEGRAAIATAGSVLSQSPDVAAGWAASIVDPDLRATTLQAVVTEWIRSNPDAARAFVERDPKLKPDDRAALLQQLRDAGRG